VPDAGLPVRFGWFLVTETGMDTFVVWPLESPARQLQSFADEVAPALREAVAAHRGRG
jgi:hypothetical protein